MASSRRGAGGPSRYQRSSTASMTQLLSDSCSSLLHRLTSRVRGPSASVDSASASSRPTQPSASFSSLGHGPTASLWSQAGSSRDNPIAVAPERAKDRDRARDRDHREPGRPRSPTFSTFGQTRSRLEKKYGQKKTTSPPPSPSARRNRHSKPRAAAGATPTRTPSTRTAPASLKETSPILGVSKVRHTDHYGARTATSPDPVAPDLGSTRSRLEDKYSAILAKYGREPRDKDKERVTAERRPAAPTEKLSPHPLPLSKSATTSIVLAEKAYPYVSSGPAREKTPYRYGERRSRHRSGHRMQPRLCPVEFSADAIDPVAVALPSRASRPMSPGEREALMLVAAHEKRERELEREREAERDRPASPVTSEREARRKEIQSLIQKYTTAVNDRLMRREQREQRELNDAAAAAATPTSSNASRNANLSKASKADSGTLTPTMGAGQPHASPASAVGLVPAVPPLGPLGPVGTPLGLGLGGSHVHAYGLGFGPGHGLGKSASGVFPSTHSDSGAIYKSLLNPGRRPNMSSSASSLALPNFKFVRSAVACMWLGPTLLPRPTPPQSLGLALRAACCV